MAGSDHSGDDLEAGRSNRAEDSTKIWAQRKDGDVFHGEALLVVEAAPNIEDEDYRRVQDSPSAPGILSSGIGVGAGVVGFSPRNPMSHPGVELTPEDLSNAEGNGVFGKGITGVVAQGDIRDPLPEEYKEKVNSGYGVGMIGRGDDGAPGVVGFCVKDKTEEAINPGTGVLGKGPNGVVGVGTHGPGVSGTGSAGTGSAGTGSPGVIGTGGKGPDPEAKQGTGVVGVGGIGVHGQGQTTGTGVYGESKSGTGIRGQSEDEEGLETGVYDVGIGVYGESKNKGTGIHGKSEDGRGAVFESNTFAQLRLVPHFQEDKVPCEGKAGDLFVKARRKEDDPALVAELWFCIRGAQQQEGRTISAVWYRVAMEGNATCAEVPRDPPQNPSLGQG
jgi:hypothetical protein